MRTLKLSTGSFDQINSFGLMVGGRHPVRVSLCRNYKVENDGVYWALNAGSMLKAHYTANDTAESDRIYRDEPPVRNGDHVMIDGAEYVCRVLGNFSDAALFDKVQA